MSDLVTELRTGRGVNEGPMRDAWVHAKMQEAAARIEQLEAANRLNAAQVAALRARIEQLEAALRPFANALKGNWSHQPDYMTITAGPHNRDLRLELLLGHFREARAALGEKE